MKFLFSVPPSLEACHNVRRLFRQALSGGYTSGPSAFSPSKEAEAELPVFVCSDPPRSHLGSGGGTIHLLLRCFHAETDLTPPAAASEALHASPVGGPCLRKGEDTANVPVDEAFWQWLSRERRVLLHAGGQSRRLPSYAPVGKLLTPLPCLLPLPHRGEEARLHQDGTTMWSEPAGGGARDFAVQATHINNNNNNNNNNEVCPRTFLFSPPPSMSHQSQSAAAHTPLPQRLEATLLAHQGAFLQRALDATPAHLRTVVMCGDVCLSIPCDGALPEVTRGDAPSHFGSQASDTEAASEEVDVLCYGLRAGVDRLRRHGVFVVDPTRSNALRCMLQKPTSAALAAAVTATPYRALLDVGVWMLSDRAVRCLAEAARQRHKAHTHGASGTPTSVAYDLFADFGACLGERPCVSGSPPTASSLRVRVVDLTPVGATFHHMGTTDDVLEATAAWAAQRDSGHGPLFLPLYGSSTATDTGKTQEAAAPLLHYVDCARRVFVQHAQVSAVTAHALALDSRFHYSTDTDATSSAECIWIDSADIGPTIALSHHHVLTGFPPDNHWCLMLPAFTCVSVCPIRAPVADAGSPWWAARVYGYHDTFAGDVRARQTQFLGTSLHEWLHVRGLTLADILPTDETTEDLDVHDIQAARLFPCTSSLATLGRLIQFLAAPPVSEAANETPDALATLWRACPRVSAAALNTCTDITRLGSLRDHFLRVALPQWLACDPLTWTPRLPAVYDAVDLHATAARWAALALPLPLTASPAVPAPAVATLYAARACVFCAQVLRCRADTDTSSSDAAIAQWDHAGFTSLQACMTAALHPTTPRAQTVFAESLPSSSSVPSSTGSSAGATSWRLPRVSVQADQVVWARSPARIDLSGGWTDTPPFSLFRGGAVVNAAVEMNGQTPIQVYVRLRDTPDLAIRSVDLGLDQVVRTYEELREYAVVGSAFSIPKAALALAGFLPDLFPADCATEPACTFSSLEEQLRRTFDGKGVELTVFVAIPAGSGLGTSSIVAGTALSALSNFCGLGWSTEDVCQRVLLLEQLLTTGGGWQDQFGGLCPGVKLVQCSAGVSPRPTVCWLAERLFTAPGLAGCHVLYYTGLTRVAKSILTEIVRGMFLNERARLAVLQEMRGQVERLCTAISYCDAEAVGALLTAAWEQNKRLDAGTCPPAVQALMERVQPYARGAKLLGAGGGGFLYIFARSETAAQRLREDLTANPPNPRARFVSMRLSDTGIQIGRS